MVRLLRRSPWLTRTILYVEGYNDLLFAGTDAGVYYRNADMDRWECFNNGFPLAVVTDLEFDYCHKMLYASTFGRSIYKCEIPFNLAGTDPNSAEIVIDQNTLWDTDKSIRQTVRILPGNTLTVTATIDILTDKKIIVEQDAKLIVQGGTLTNLCDGFWGGIEVWGTTSLSQFTPDHGQGEVVISQNSLIEHAEVAVALWKPADWSTTGGILRVYNSTFKNNKKDVEFMNYSNNYNGQHYANKGLFTDVSFIWDNEFRAEIPLAHVTLYRVDGINFNGCTFGDYRDPGTTLAFNNVGIWSIDAKYRVQGHCNSVGGCTGNIDDPGSGWDPTIFENLYFGIRASNATTTYTINVDRCIFKDNGYGIHLQNVPSPVIVRNKFEFSATPLFFVGSAVHGIQAINSKMLIIQENTFIDLNPGNHGVGSFGVVSTNLGQQEEAIRKNSFTGISYANFAQGQNRDYSGTVGLYFPCNSNVNNNSDHFVVNTLWNLPGTNYGVKVFSGSELTPTGTTFTYEPISIAHFENYHSAHDIHYYRQNIHPAYDFTSNVTMEVVSSQNNCPSILTNYPGGIGKLIIGDKSAYESGFTTTSNLILSKEAEYNDNLLDESEIASILLAIDNLEPNNKQDVRDMLNSYSHYLTTEVLFAVADNTPSDINHPWLRDLLLANIEAVTPELLVFLETKEFPLPAPMRATVANAMGVTFTEKTALEAEISQLYADRAFYSYQLIMGIQHDSDYVNTDSLRHRIILQDNIFYQQLIIDSYLQDGNFIQAKTATDNFAALALSAPANLRQEILDFVKLKRWLLFILLSPDKIANLDESNLNFVRDLALNGAGTARDQAENILCFFYNECLENFIVIESGPRSQILTPYQTTEAVQPTFSIYPNPAANWVMIELSQNTFDQLENAEIIITDITGKAVHQTNLTRNTFLWETGNVQNGIYLIILRSNDVLFETKKVVVSH